MALESIEEVFEATGDHGDHMVQNWGTDFASQPDNTRTGLPDARLGSFLSQENNLANLGSVNVPIESPCDPIEKKSSYLPLLDQQPRKRKRTKRCKRLPPAAVAVLDDWFVKHRANPYPTPLEKAALVSTSSLTLKQVDTWFANARQRQKDPATAPNPFELWLSSSSDDEAANIDDIRKAAAQTDMRSSSSALSLGRQSSEAVARVTSMSSVGSAFDGCPQARMRGPPKRGRKTYGHYAPSQHGSMSSAADSSPALVATHLSSESMFKAPFARQSQAAMLSKKNATKFMLGGSSDEGDVSSIEGDYLRNRPDKLTSFDNAVFSREVKVSEAHEAVFEDSDEEDDDEISSEIDDEDDESDWEDDIEDSPPPATMLFQRVDSRPTLRARRSLLSFATKLKDMPEAASEVIPVASSKSRSKSEEETSTCVRSNPIDIRRPLSPRTTRRNMLNTELTKSLREHLLWERTVTESLGTTRPHARTMHDTTHRSKSLPRQTGTKLQYQCTFCHLKLSQGAWKRHEESQHLPQRQFVCMPYETPCIDGSCAFCQQNIPSDLMHNDQCKHRVNDCLKRSFEQRTFTRKDKLEQHIKNFHSCSVRKDLVDQWAHEPVDNPLSWACGFCNASSMTWDDRAKHIANHFREGKDMSMWGVRAW